MKCGISTLQGPHHVAQKSSRMTLPLNDVSDTFLSTTSLRVKLRLAAFASAGHDKPADLPGIGLFLPQLTTAAASATAATVAMAQRPFISDPRLSSSRLHLRLHERGHARHVVGLLTGEQDDGPIAGGPDCCLVSQHVNELFAADD